MTNDASKPAKASKDALLGELESIKELLDKYQDDDPPANDIPLLDDVVDQKIASEHKTEADQKLLDLDNIFGDGDDMVLDQGEQLNNNSQAAEFDELEDLEDLDELDIDINIPGFTLSTTVQEDEPFNASEAQETTQPANGATHEQSKTGQPTIDVDLIVQEIVDEYIPTIEKQLRQRLSEYAPEALSQLVHKLNKP
jgi:hypothetical protein